MSKPSLKEKFISLIFGEDDTSGYPETRPELSFVSYLLLFGVGLGLIALWLAALEAFYKVMSPWHAFFSASVLEFSAVVEAIALAKARTWKDTAITVLAIICSLVVSGTYNYVQVKNHGLQNSVTDPWQLYAFALGPLAALTFLAINFGRQLRAVETLTDEWNKNRSKWIDAQNSQRTQNDERLARELAEKKSQAQELERQERLAALQAEREAQARRDELAHQAELLRIKSEAKIRLANARKSSENLDDNSHKPPKNYQRDWVRDYMEKHGKSRPNAYLAFHKAHPNYKKKSK